MTNQKNQDIRKAASSAGVALWELAYALGVQDSTLSKWLRKEFTPELKLRAMKIIESLGEDEGDSK